MNIKIGLLLFLTIFLAGFLLSTNPDNTPLYFLLVPFLIITFMIYIFTQFLINFFLEEKNTAKTKIFSAVLAIIVVNFLLLRSIDQLTFQDGLISVAITIMLAFYISKFQLKT